MEHPISIKENLLFGWETFKKRPWFIIGAVLIMGVFSVSFSYEADSSGEIMAALPIMIALGLALGAIRLAVELLFTRFMLMAHDSVETMTYMETLPAKPFWKYVGGKIAVAVTVFAGIVLLVIPGIIAAIGFLFTPYLIVDRKLWPIEAMKESWRITKGHKWQLFLLMLVLGLINIIGALALFVGLLVSIPVSMLAVVHVYRALEKQSPPMPEVVTG